MAYVVLARKWRPLVFEDVVGQEHVTRTLMNALQQNRVAHAYIFAGPRGVGKTTTARLLAKAVNCERQPAVNPCNQCPSCVAITEGTSLDVIEIDGASNRGIDEIRNLRENIRFAPAASRYKIYIIDEVHMLTKEAFNALLKTLEEPPPHAIFIFATTEIHRVPLTILSRCQRFDFKRIPSRLIVQQLQKIAEKEQIQIDEESLLLIARKAEGGMRDALSILDQLISYTEGAITASKVRESLGLIHEELYFEFTDLMLQKADAKIIDYAQRLFEQGHDLMDFLYGLQDHFRNLLVVRSTGSTRLLEVSDGVKQLYQEKAGNFSEKDLIHYLDILVQSENLLKFSPNPQLILELLLLKLSHKPRAVDVEALLSRLRSGGWGGGPAGEGGDSRNVPSPGTVSGKPAGPSRVQAPAATPASSRMAVPPIREKPVADFEQLKQQVKSRQQTPAEKPATSVKISLEELQERWDQIIETIKKQKIALGSFLQDGVPWKLEGGFLEIAFDPRTRFHMEHVQKNATIIERIFARELNLPLRIRCVEQPFDQAGIKKKVHSPEEILEDIKNKEPVLNKIIELFDCTEAPDLE
ncbi:MAG: DNA polymerase III subunit gamma/tau [Calditrichaeota bacterium]|nr:DNA polymerase III subunit gamma/tau [Calditrichota bacterium]